MNILLLTIALSSFDTNMQNVMNNLLIIDWKQSQNITERYDEGFYETNQLLGRQPHVDRVNLHFVASIAGLNYIGRSLGTRNRRMFYGVVIATELLFVIKNKRIGLEVKF